MAQLDLKVTEYIAKSEDFAKPIMEHWHKLMHETCPDMVEAIKYGIPHFDYKRDYMCVMAAYNSFRKKYILWVLDAKTEETRQKRMAEALVKIAAGVGRFVKF